MKWSLRRLLAPRERPEHHAGIAAAIPKRQAWYRWAVLGSNQRPLPCKGSFTVNSGQIRPVRPGARAPRQPANDRANRTRCPENAPSCVTLHAPSSARPPPSRRSLGNAPATRAKALQNAAFSAPRVVSSHDKRAEGCPRRARCSLTPPPTSTGDRHAPNPPPY